jgi:hypothetical protein
MIVAGSSFRTKTTLRDLLRNTQIDIPESIQLREAHHKLYKQCVYVIRNTGENTISVGKEKLYPNRELAVLSDNTAIELDASGATCAVQIRRIELLDK